MVNASRVLLLLAEHEPPARPANASKLRSWGHAYARVAAARTCFDTPRHHHRQAYHRAFRWISCRWLHVPPHTQPLPSGGLESFATTPGSCVTKQPGACLGNHTSFLPSWFLRRRQEKGVKKVCTRDRVQKTSPASHPTHELQRRHDAHAARTGHENGRRCFTNAARKRT